MRSSALAVDELNPAQLEVLAVLGASGRERPTFDAELRHRLVAGIEAAIGPLADSGDPLYVSKHDLAGVHGCEARYLAEREFPGWSVATARGTVAHKAIELSVHVRGEPSPLELVEEALSRLTESDRSLGAWLQTISEIERAELKSVANNRVATFLETWPPLRLRWRPVTESPVRVELCGGAFVLRGKVDLTLGRATGTTAGKVLVDLKTGGFSPTHLEDLRFYALLETIKLGVPPRRVASYYLDAARAVPADIDEDALLAAARRLIDGVTKLVALRAAETEPHRRPGPVCRWCSLLDGCEVGQISIGAADE